MRKFLLNFMRARLKSRPLKVTVICDGLQIPSVELCINLPFEYMREKSLVDYDIYSEFDNLDDRILEGKDILLIMRGATSLLADFVERNYKRVGAVVYMTDDDIHGLMTDLPSDNAIRKHYEHLGAVSNIERILKYCTSALVFSELLQRRYLPLCNMVRVVPAAAGLEMFDLIRRRSMSLEKNGELRLGYAGSATHSEDIALLGGALVELLDRYENLFIETIDQQMELLVGHPRYRAFPGLRGLEPFSEFLLSRSWDIGISPLRESISNMSKTDNKYRTYAAAGIPGAYSNRRPFVGSVRSGHNGVLVDDGAEFWARSLKDLLDDSCHRSRIICNSQQDIKSRYGLDVVSRVYMGIFTLSMRQN